MTKRYLKSELIRLAAEMVRGQGMPSNHYDDWDWPKSMPSTAWGEVRRSANKAQEQCRQWGIAIKELADKIKEEP